MLNVGLMHIQYTITRAKLNTGGYLQRRVFAVVRLWHFLHGIRYPTRVGCLERLNDRWYGHEIGTGSSGLHGLDSGREAWTQDSTSRVGVVGRRVVCGLAVSVTVHTRPLPSGISSVLVPPTTAISPAHESAAFISKVALSGRTGRIPSGSRRG